MNMLDTRRTSRAILWAAVLLAASCRSSPKAEPTTFASGIAEKLAAGKEKEADRRMDAIRKSDRHREVAFSVLYSQAQELYGRGDYETATRFLRLPARHFPKAGAPKEALLYTLFLARARDGRPFADKTLAEADRLAEALRKRDANAPVWVDLIAAQIAIDRGKSGTARDALARFHARWDGSPPALRAYVEEVDRYVATHREDQT